MKIFKHLLTVSLLLLLTGCGTPLGLALGAAGSSATSFVVGAAADDIAEAAIWRSKQQEIVSTAVRNLLQFCEKMQVDKFDDALDCYNKVLNINEEQQPKILVERLAQRYRQAKARRAESAEEPNK